MSKTNKTTLYKYMNVKYVAETIEKSRIFLSDGSKFNDPFELLVADPITHKSSRISGLHILCLTNSNSKKLMWSHYADSHKGVCLAIEVPAHLTYPVCYTEKRIFSDSDLDKILSSSKFRQKKNLIKPYSAMSREKKIAFIKDHKWNYEKEYRLVFDDDDLGLIHEGEDCYMSVKIKRIYLGAAFSENSDDCKAKIIEVCNRNQIEIREMTLSPKEYSICLKKKRSFVSTPFQRVSQNT